MRISAHKIVLFCFILEFKTKIAFITTILGKQDFRYKHKKKLLQLSS